MVEYNHTDYATSKGILAFPEPYVCVAQTFRKDDSAAVDMDGRKIIPAGTIYPSNDANAQGVVFYDIDVTNGDRTGSLLIFGFIKRTGIPTQPTEAAAAALKMVAFLPLAPAATTLTANTLSIAAGEASGTEHVVQVAISGAHFNDAAGDKANWDITGDTTSKVAVESVTVDPSGKFVTFVTKNSAAAAAGSTTVKPKANAVSTGKVPSAAATIATVTA